MEFGSGPNPPNQFRYTFRNRIVEKMTSAKHASQTSKMEIELGTSLPNQFRYTIGDKKK